MIKELRNKISLIVLFAIGIPLIIGIIIYDVSYYNNIINSNGRVVDRFFGDPGGPKNGKIENEPNRAEMPYIEGVYSIIVDDGKLSSNTDKIPEEIEEYALKASNKNSSDGIVGNYIYKKRIDDKNKTKINIVLIESSKEIKKINLVIAVSIIIAGIGIILVYILSRRIATLIVKPVDNTFNKQIDFISDASHELKTPLAVIQANTDVLEGEIGKNNCYHIFKMKPII